VPGIRDLFSKKAPNEAKKRGAPLDIRRVLAPIGLAMLIAGTALFGFQTWQAWRSDGIASRAEQVAGQARQSLAGFISERQRALGEALLHPEVARYFASGDRGDSTRALAGIRERMPEVEDARFIGGNVLDAIGEDMAGFGYANAEMLLSAARLGAPAPAQVHGSAGKRELVLVNPVTLNGNIAGFVLAKLPYAPLQQTFIALPRGGVELSLLQGETGLGSPLEGIQGSGLTVTAVPGAMLRIGHRAPFPIILMGPESFANNLVTALVCLLGAALVVLWRQRPDLIELLLHPRVRGPSSEQTVNQMLGKQSAVLTPAVAAPPTDGPASEAKTPTAATRPAEERPPPAPKKTAGEAGSRASGAVDRRIFRAFDIRGVVGKDLTSKVAQLVGQAVGSEVRSKGLQTVLVGRDGRLSGVELSDALIKGLLVAGCDVIDLGAVPTPTLQFAIEELNAGSAVMVTGSHYPAEQNGFKIIIGGEILAEQELQSLYARIAEDRFEQGRGALTQMDLNESYIERISGDIQLEAPLKVVIDCGNGVTGLIAQRLYEAIGCEVVPLYTDVDGSFPNHLPNPTEPGNMDDLIVSVKQLKADIGLAFDGDGDRLGVVTKQGKVIGADRLLMLFARDVLTRTPGATVIYDVKCSGHLSGVILGHGGSPIMWKSGHTLIRRKMQETQAELAGEMSGHFFFKERWYGFDDGLYAGCRLLEIIAAEGRDADEIFDELPQAVNSAELKVPMAEGEHYRFMEKFRERSRFDGARITLIDGVRADWSDGWGLVRCSTSSPSLVLRFEAADGDGLARIQGAFKAQLLSLDAKLALPF